VIDARQHVGVGIVAHSTGYVEVVEIAGSEHLG